MLTFKRPWLIKHNYFTRMNVVVGLFLFSGLFFVTLNTINAIYDLPGVPATTSGAGASLCSCKFKLVAEDADVLSPGGT